MYGNVQLCCIWMYENFQFGSRWKEILDWRGWGKEKWGWEWVLELVLNWGMIFYVRIFAGPAGAADRPLAAGCLLAAMPRRDSWCPVGAMPPRMGRNPCGENLFFFCGEAEVFYLAVGFCLLGWGIPLAGKPPFHLPARRGPKPLFLFREKKTAVLDSEKEKVDRRKFWGGAVQQDGGPILLGCSSGKIRWAILLSSAACV